MEIANQRVADVLGPLGRPGDIEIVVVIAGQLDDPPRAARPGDFLVAGSAVCACGFAVRLFRGGSAGSRGDIQLGFRRRLIPAAILHHRKPRRQIVGLLAIDRGDVQLVAMADVLRPGVFRVRRQALVDRRQQLQPNEPTFDIPGQVRANLVDALEFAVRGIVFRHQSGGPFLNAIGLAFRLGPGIVFDGRQNARVAHEAQRATEQQNRRGGHRPRFLVADHPLLEEFLRQQIRPQRRLLQRLDGQAVSHAERSDILLKRRHAQDFRPDHARIGIGPFHLKPEVLGQVSPQARQLHRAAQGDHSSDLRAAVDACEIADRPLDLRHQIVENRTHGLEHNLRVFRRGGVPLEVFRLGKGQLQLLGQRARKMVAAKRDAPLPDAMPVGDHQVRCVRAHRQHNRRFRWVLRIEILAERLLKPVEGDVIVERQRRQLDDFDLDPRRPIRLQRAEHLFALHRKQANFRLQRKSLDLLATTTKRLVVPDHVVEVEGNLLTGLIADNLGNLLGLDRRQLDEPRQPILPRHRNRHAVAADAVP